MGVLCKSVIVDSRKHARDTVAHLLNADKNENIRFLVGSESDLISIPQDAYLLNKGGGKGDIARHYIISCDESWTDEQMFDAVRCLTSSHNIDGHQYVAVAHIKLHTDGSERPEHIHIFGISTNPLTLTKPKRHLDYVVNERISRDLEFAWNMSPTKGHHNKSVAAWYNKVGQSDKAEWLEKHGLLDGRPACSAVSDPERRAALREGREDPVIVAQTLQKASRQVDPIRALVDAGYAIARGLNGTIVAIDQSGKAVSLGRKLKLGKADIEARFSGVDLPTAIKGQEKEIWLKSQEKVLDSENIAEQENPGALKTGSTDPLAGADIVNHPGNKDDSDSGKGGKAGEDQTMASCPDMTDGVADFGVSEQLVSGKQIPQNILEAVKFIQNGGLKNVSITEKSTGNIQSCERSQPEGSDDYRHADRRGKERSTESDRPAIRANAEDGRGDRENRTKGRVSKAAIKRIYQAKLNVALSNKLGRLEGLKLWLTSDQLLAHQFEVDAKKLEERAVRPTNVYQFLDADKKAKQLEKLKGASWFRWQGAKVKLENFERMNDRPEGWIARLMGKISEYDSNLRKLSNREGETKKLYGKLLNKYDEKIQHFEEKAISNADANAKDLLEATRKRQISEALKNGNKAVLDAIRSGDIQKAGELSKPVEKPKNQSWKPKKQYQQPSPRKDSYDGASGPKM